MAHLPRGASLLLGLWISFFTSGLAGAGAVGETEFRMAQEKFRAGEYQTAATLLSSAVRQGHEAAQVPLAAMLRAGQGVEQDFPQAFKLFTRAAYQGYPAAQFALGMMYRLGQGTETNQLEALKWFVRAASVGHAEAQNSLGVVYETGRGLKADYVKAMMWYQLAKSRGSRRGRDNLNRLSHRMKASEITEAKKLAADCEKGGLRRCTNQVGR